MRRGRALAWAAETNRPQCPPPETRVRTRRGPEHLEAPRPTPAQKVLVERHGRRDPHPILVFLVAPVCCLPKAEPVSEVLLHVKRHEGAVGGDVGRDRRLQRCDRPVPEIFAPQDGPCEAGHRTRRALVPNPARGRRLQHARASCITIALVVVVASRRRGLQRSRVTRRVEPQPVTVFVLERLDLVRGQVLLDGADHRDALAWEHEGPLPSLRHPPPPTHKTRPPRSRAHSLASRPFPPCRASPRPAPPPLSIGIQQVQVLVIWLGWQRPR